MRVICRRTNKEYTKYCLAYSLFQSTSSVWRTTEYARPCERPTTYFNPRPPCGERQQKQRKISICIHIIQQFVQICNRNIAPMLSFAQIRTNNPPKKLVRSIRVRSARFTFARPSPPGEALRKSARHPDGRRGELRCVQPCFGNGCPAGKSSGQHPSGRICPSGRGWPRHS